MTTFSKDYSDSITYSYSTLFLQIDLAKDYQKIKWNSNIFSRVKVCKKNNHSQGLSYLWFFFNNSSHFFHIQSPKNYLKPLSCLTMLSKYCITWSLIWQENPKFKLCALSKCKAIFWVFLSISNNFYSSFNAGVVFCVFFKI